MDDTLKYLRESLANYSEHELCQQINQKLESADYDSEGDFVKTLDDREMAYLNDVLEREINYAKNVQNDIRVSELNEVYELLF
ncbi:sporulation protein [Virgibacillus doumboii]|uniref:sporulation protein n=1 Tax=Virgibacillus doumboii TaxID=2697503 RepID=UPI0013DEDAF0|nr:sporulation protein [Virgibacillus doumboii]